MDEHSIVTCVYCGYQYPDGTPETKHQLLHDHIKQCPEHPLSKAIKLIEEAYKEGYSDACSDCYDIEIYGQRHTMEEYMKNKWNKSITKQEMSDL